MKTKTIKLYEYSELSPEAKKRALEKWNEHNFDDYYLQVELDNYLDELLEESGIKPVADLKGYETNHAKIYYSLGYSQGDGAMFEGRFEWNGYNVTVRQSGHYYHYNSKDISIYTNDQQDEVYDEKVHEDFNDIYIKISKKLEKRGYETIEDMQSEAYFIETCNANEYTFREDGTMENE